MGSVILAAARFRSNKKEAISKNFVNLAEGLAIQGHKVITVTPTHFQSDFEIDQHTFRKSSQYASLGEALCNLIRVCFIINRLINSESHASVNIHIATPVELLIIYIFLKSSSRSNITVSIWQSYITFRELRGDWRYYALNLHKYSYLIFFNSFLMSFLYSLLLSSFKHIIVHSRYQWLQLKSISSKEIAFVQNGVFSENLSISNKKLGDQLQLIYIGHAKPSKGVDILIELAAILKARHHVPFHLTICLSGFGAIAPIEKLVDRYKVHEYITFKEDIDVITEMSHADILLLPLRTCVGTSLSPNIVVEAISCGLPIATANYKQLQGLIKFGMNAAEINLAPQ